MIWKYRSSRVEQRLASYSSPLIVDLFGTALASLELCVCYRPNLIHLGHHIAIELRLMGPSNVLGLFVGPHRQKDSLHVVGPFSSILNSSENWLSYCLITLKGLQVSDQVFRPRLSLSQPVT